MKARVSEGYKPAFDLDLRYGKASEQTVANWIEGFTNGTHEVKSDRQTVDTGNVWIEYECRGRDGVWRDSGIRTTEAHYWDLVLGECIILAIPTTILRRCVVKAMEPSLRMTSAEKDGSNPTHGVRIPLNLLLTWLRMELHQKRAA
jgi:hypothetical protein